MTGIHNGTYCFADNHHFIDCQAMPSGVVARRAAWQDISFYVWQVVIHAVKASMGVSRSAIVTRLGYYLHHFLIGQIASISSLVRLSEKNSPAFFRFCIAPIALVSKFSLVVRHIAPAVRPKISSKFSFAHALAAFIGQAKGPRRITRKDFWRCWQLLFATVANSMIFKSGAAIISHAPFYFTKWIFGPKDGPHFQLPWAEYP